MAYREELEAAQYRIASLEEKVRRLSARESPVQSELNERIRVLENVVRALLGTSGKRMLLATCYGPAGAVVAVLGLAFFLVTRTPETGAWEAVNVAIMVGVIAPGWSWGRARRLLPWLVSCAFKVTVLAAWAYPFWAPMQKRVVEMDSSLGVWHAGFYFFWGAPAFVLLMALAEGVALHLLLRFDQSTFTNGRD